MKQEAKQRIEELIKDCPKGLKVSKPEFGIPCKAKHIALNSFAECLAKDSHTCKLSMPFGRKYYCRCPAGVLIAKELTGQ
jgi:hypothetical protein